MRLTKLELHGFKSFADQTELLFEPGATAIVGPNGCGKSNVSDAVRWVLGEQRARALRGAKMEEVIFQGSSARKPVNIAEVSLHFENDDGALNIPFREVVITRRLSRSGDSDYFINRSPARLRDIQDMVRGTGLGADSGVVIESKMIDALLSDRPDDRRELFEEASGIGLYRDRKRSTERRLEETTLDLSRIDDLINEVQSQVRSLSRQRKRAERHTELMSRRFVVEIALAGREMAEWREELDSLQERVSGLREAVPGEQEQLETTEADKDAAYSTRVAAEASRSELAKLVGEQRTSVQQLRSEIAVAEERRRNAVARRERAEEERREGGDTASRVETELATVVTERQQLAQSLDTIKEELEERSRLEESARHALTSARATVEQAERRAHELREQSHRLTLDRQGAERETYDITQRREALRAEQLQLFDTAEAIGREVEELQLALELARIRVVETSESLEAAQFAAQAAREADSIARADMVRSQESFAALEGKFHALEALERERVGLAPAAAQLLAARDQFGDDAILGPLSDYISAGSASAALVERYLGATLHAVLVRDHDVAEQVRAWHTQANPGSLLLLPVDTAFGEEPSVDDQDLAHQVESSSSSAMGWVKALLGKVKSVESGSAFVDSRGAVWLPAAGTGPGPLRRRAELQEVAAQLETAEETKLQLIGVAERAREAMHQAVHASNEAADIANVATREVKHSEERVNEATRRHERAAREVSQSEAILAKLTEREEMLVERMRVIDEQLEMLVLEVAEHDTSILELRRALSESEQAHDDTREQRTAFQVQQAQAQARTQVIIDRERRLHEELTNAALRLESLQSEVSTLSDADAELAEQLSDWQLNFEAKEGMLHDIEEQYAAAELAVKTADESLSTVDQRLNEIRRRATSAAEQLHSSELRYTELSGRQAAVRERLETEWKKPLEELLEQAQTLEEDNDTLRAEVTKLRDQLDNLGPVNPLAIEEHDEELKRLEFIQTQRTDLMDARASLHQAIKEIDTTARDMFLQTFVQVRENFRHIFMTLFGGGDCDLRLENTESPFDGDIEIHASPRGKKTQRIHLLSSGEKALVALSLLFGIFLMKPSPFCLLDEVDAPLDDQNIGRFIRMLNEFKKNTQFIVITHNPRTSTEAADAVYGVTMQEPGVSSIVSVRLRGKVVEDLPTPTATQNQVVASSDEDNDGDIIDDDAQEDMIDAESETEVEV